jgi:hypothetical protein
MRKNMMIPTTGRMYMSNNQAVADEGLRFRGMMKSSTRQTIQKMRIVMSTSACQINLQAMLYLLL